MEKEELKKDKKKMLGELKHVKRKKKNKIVIFLSLLILIYLGALSRTT